VTKSTTTAGKTAAAKTATRTAAKPASKAATKTTASSVSATTSAKPASKAASKVGTKASAVPVDMPVTPSASAPAPAPSSTKSASPPKASTAKPSSTPNMPAPATKVDAKLANAWKTKSGRELTEAELMAMPDTEYMSDKQLDFFRAILETQKDDLLSNAGETTEHLREDTSIVPDPADRATIEEEHALELRTRDRERKLLKKISQALTRIEAGDYGFCDETGEPIGLGRLIARPTATLSLEAQQRRELKQKMFGD
jgi:DnaK suppressor protein